MKPRRFKVEDLSAQLVRLDGAEAHHALRVLRLKAGAEVILFNGQGQEAGGRICEVSRDSFTVELAVRRQAAPPATATLILAVATPKGERADWLVEKCAEIGTTALWLLETERGSVHPGEGKLARWRRKAAEAAKQAGNAATMDIEPPQPVADVLAAATPARMYYGDPDRAKVSLLTALRADLTASEAPQRTLILIGPEGGFTDAECQVIERAGGRAVRLASAILRVETAAVAAASVWSICYLD